MPGLADKKIMKSYSMCLLFSDNGTKKYLPGSSSRSTKNNQKNMNQ